MIPLLFSTEDAISTIYTHTHKMLVLKPQTLLTLR